MAPKNLLIFGAGRLGTRAGKLWLSENSNGTVFTLTRSPDRFAPLESDGFTPLLELATDATYDDVLIALPASVQSDEILQAAVKSWNRRGQLLLISSTRIYSEKNNGPVLENSATDQDGSLAAAENIILAAGGSVVRLTGLYDEASGPHLSYLKNESASGPRDGFLNLIHYADAARLTVRALGSEKKGGIYMGSDGEPILRGDFAALVFEAAEKIDRLPNVKFGSSEELGKRCHCDWTMRTLNWKPKWTFRSWVTRN